MAKKGKAAKEPKAVKPSKAEKAEAKRQKRMARLEDQLHTARELHAAVGALVGAIEEEFASVRAPEDAAPPPDLAASEPAPRRVTRRPKLVPPAEA